MAIKDNMNYIKTEFSSQEQFLENIIRSERFLRKYKKALIVIAIIIVAALVFYIAKIQVENSRIDSANKAYETLLSDPKNEKAKATLIAKSPSLFALYALNSTKENNSTKDINQALSLNLDPLLKGILNSAAKENTSSILGPYSSLLKGYELLKENKISRAKTEFAQIPPNSPLYPLAKNLEHYQGQ